MRMNFIGSCISPIGLCIRKIGNFEGQCVKKTQHISKNGQEQAEIVYKFVQLQLVQFEIKVQIKR